MYPPRAKILKVRWSHHIKARGKMSQMFAFGLQPPRLPLGGRSWASTPTCMSVRVALYDLAMSDSAADPRNVDAVCVGVHLFRGAPPTCC
jgi:hypothetical protein